MGSRPRYRRVLLFPLLEHSKAEVRSLAIAYFIMRYPKERLKDIYENIELPTYYYNVVLA
jgi:hypothetical protein